MPAIRRQSEEQIARLHDMHRRGFKGVEIAKELGIAPQTVNYHIRGRQNRQVKRKKKAARDGGSTVPHLAHIAQLTDREYEMSKDPTEQQEEALSKRIYAIAEQVRLHSCSRILPPDEKS